MNVPTPASISIRARQVLRFIETGYTFADKLKPDDIEFAKASCNDTAFLTRREPVYPSNWAEKAKSLTTFLTWWRTRAREYNENHTFADSTILEPPESALSRSQTEQIEECKVTHNHKVSREMHNSWYHRNALTDP
jgi:hypothetical protein